MQLRPYQQDLYDKVHYQWHQGNRNVLAIAPTGAGKCLGKGTPILMYNGDTLPVQDVKTGDLLMGPDSTPRKVLGTCTGREMLYRVTPTKGDPYIVNESHILSLKTTKHNSKPKGHIVNVSVTDYLNKSKTWKHVHKGWRTGVDFPTVAKTDTALPSYLLGVWLGDGDSKGASITTADPEIVTYLQNYAIKTRQGLRIEAQPNNASSVYHLSTNFNRNVIGLRKSLKYWNLLNNKHIPFDFKTAPREQRLSLLAGLLDSDGYLTRGGYDVVFKVKRLAEDLCFLARSLGFAAYINETEKTCTNTGATGTYYRISISGDCTVIPTILDRHQPESRKQKKDVLVTGIKVEPIGVGDYYGFEIDGDHLFMLGDFTVTHNTVTMAKVIHDHNGAKVAIAHRQELVSQISQALAREGIHHNIVGDKKVIKLIRRNHIDELGRDFIQPMSTTVVAGVDTLIRRKESLRGWAQQVTLWVQDEAHHVLKHNKWGNAIEMFPNAKGLGVTATPIRADGHGLGSTASGVFDVMVEGPNLRWLINNGYLTDYKIVCSPSDIQLGDDDLGANGDFIQKRMKKAARESHIIGDVVSEYKKHAFGKRGVTFVTDVETAKDMAAEYNAFGIPAEAVDANTPSDLRDAILKRFARGELWQLVNVDLFGEGFDLPAIEVVSFARPTMSYALYVQQFGRALRKLEGKTWAIIIDHVGNIIRHGLPDKPRVWSLDSKDKSPRTVDPDDEIPLTYCASCTRPYEKFHKKCPHCGYYTEPAGRSKPEQVDGDLTELSADVLAMMRGEVDNIANTTPEQAAKRVTDELIAKHAPTVAILSHSKRAAQKQVVLQDAQHTLRETIAWWASLYDGADQSEMYRRFNFAFGMDVLSAQKQDADAMIKTTNDINNYIIRKMTA